MQQTRASYALIRRTFMSETLTLTNLVEIARPHGSRVAVRLDEMA